MASSAMTSPAERLHLLSGRCRARFFGLGLLLQPFHRPSEMEAHGGLTCIGIPGAQPFQDGLVLREGLCRGTDEAVLVCEEHHADRIHGRGELFVGGNLDEAPVKIPIVLTVPADGSPSERVPRLTESPAQPADLIW